MDTNYSSSCNFIVTPIPIVISTTITTTIAILNSISPYYLEYYHILPHPHLVLLARPQSVSFSVPLQKPTSHKHLPPCMTINLSWKKCGRISYCERRSAMVGRDSTFKRILFLRLGKLSGRLQTNFVRGKQLMVCYLILSFVIDWFVCCFISSPLLSSSPIDNRDDIPKDRVFITSIHDALKGRKIPLRMFEFPDSLCIQIYLSNKNGEDYFTLYNSSSIYKNVRVFYHRNGRATDYPSLYTYAILYSS